MFGRENVGANGAVEPETSSKRNIREHPDRYPKGESAAKTQTGETGQRLWS